MPKRFRFPVVDAQQQGAEVIPTGKKNLVSCHYRICRIDISGGLLAGGKLPIILAGFRVETVQFGAGHDQRLWFAVEIRQHGRGGAGPLIQYLPKDIASVRRKCHHRRIAPSNLHDDGFVGDQWR